MERRYAITISRSGHLGYWSSMLLFYLIVIVRNLFSIPIPIVILLLIPMYIGIRGTKNEIIAFAISCLVLGSTFQYKYALLFLILAFSRFRSSRSLNKYVVPIILMMFWELMHVFVDSQFIIYEYFRQFAELLFVMLLLSDSQKNYDYTLVIDSLVISTVVICFVILLRLINTGEVYTLLSSKYRFGVASEDLQYGANISDNRLGTICNISILCLLQKQHLKGDSLFDTINLFLLIFFGILTKSRTFLMCLGLNMLFFFTIPSRMKKGKKNSLIIIVVLVGVWLLFQNQMSDIFGSFVDRFKDTDVTNGRNALLLYYHNLITHNTNLLLFGLGMQNLADKLSNFSSLYVNVPHNGIQEVIVVWGLPGLILIISYFVSMIKSAKKYNFHISRINYYPIFFMLIVIQAGQFVRSEIIMMITAVIYLSLLTDFSRKETGYDNNV